MYICVCVCLCVNVCFVLVWDKGHMQPRWFNTLRPRQYYRHFADDIFKCIFVNENVWISIKISLKFISSVPINNIPALVQLMAWRWPGDKQTTNIQLSVVITRSNITRYCLHHCSDGESIYIRNRIYKIYIVSRPNGWIMLFGENWPRYDGTE